MLLIHLSVLEYTVAAKVLMASSSKMSLSSQLDQHLLGSRLVNRDCTGANCNSVTSWQHEAKAFMHHPPPPTTFRKLNGLAI